MLEYFIDPRIIIGAIIGAAVMYFVYHNNKKLMDSKFDEAKAVFDAKEKELRAKIEESQIDAKIKELLAKAGIKVQ